MLKKAKPYIISSVIALAVGGVSTLLTKDAMKDYENLSKPALSPPQAVFPIVWTILFILMGISSAKVYTKSHGAAKGSMLVYGIQLGVNFFWTIIFFGSKSFLFAFFWLLFLIALVIDMIYMFSKHSLWAGLLQLPYLVWLCFAAYLNLMVHLMNK